MPKFYTQNKKKIDPRYFMDEITEGFEEEEEQRRAGTTVAGDWPGSERPPWASSNERPEDRARALAQQGMEQAAASRGNMGVFDGTMEDGTSVRQVLDMVRKQLNIPGGTAVLQKFDQLLKELGVTFDEPPSSADHEGFDPGADAMEDKLSKFRDASEEDEEDEKHYETGGW